MKAIFSIAADSIIRDGERNSLTIVEMLEQVTVFQFPSAIPRLSCCFIVEKDDDDVEQSYDLQLVIDAPQIPPQPFPVKADFRDGRKTRVITRMEGLVVFAPGTVSVHLKQGDTILGTTKVDVVQAAGSGVVIRQVGPAMGR